MAYLSDIQNFESSDSSSMTNESAEENDNINSTSDESSPMVILSAYDLPSEGLRISPSAWTVRGGIEEEPIRHRTRIPKFKAFNPALLRQVQSHKKSYEVLHVLAITHAYKQLYAKIEALHRIHVCKYENKIKNMTAPFRMFSWSQKNFMDRSQQVNVWIDVLRKNYSAACLDAIKFKIDMEELMRICKTLFGPFYCDVQNLAEAIAPSLQDALDFLKIEHKLADELEHNLTTLRQCLNELLSITLNIPEKTYHFEKLPAIHAEIEKVYLYAPIETRYRLGYCYARAALMEYSIKKQTDALEKELEQCKKQLKCEDYRSQCVLNTYYADIEKYKSHIVELTNEYNKNMELMENSTEYKKLAMTKITTRHAFLSEQMVRFQEDLQQYQARLLAEQKQHDELRKSEVAPTTTKPKKTKKERQAVKRKKR